MTKIAQKKYMIKSIPSHRKHLILSIHLLSFNFETMLCLSSKPIKSTLPALPALERKYVCNKVGLFLTTRLKYFTPVTVTGHQYLYEISATTVRDFEHYIRDWSLAYSFMYISYVYIFCICRCGRLTCCPLRSRGVFWWHRAGAVHGAGLGLPRS